MIAIADPRTLELLTVALNPFAGVRDRIMISVLVLAAAFQDPGTLCYDVKERGTSTSCCMTPADKSIPLLQ